MSEFKFNEYAMTHSTTDKELDGLIGKVVGVHSDGFFIVQYPVTLARGYSTIVLTQACLKPLSECT